MFFEIFGDPPFPVCLGITLITTSFPHLCVPQYNINDFFSVVMSVITSQAGNIISNSMHSCDQCDYKSKWKIDVKRHIESVHGDVLHSCDQCDFKTKYNLKRHIDSVHGDVRSV